MDPRGYPRRMETDGRRIGRQPDRAEAPLLNRKKIAHYLRVSLFTLHDWMNRGLPHHKKDGRVYFLKVDGPQWVKTHHTSWTPRAIRKVPVDFSCHHRKEWRPTVGGSGIFRNPFDKFLSGPNFRVQEFGQHGILD